MNLILSVRTLLVLLTVVVWALPVKATPPKIEPFDPAFERFCNEYVSRSQSLVQLLRVGLSRDRREETEEAFKVLERYIQNVRADGIPGVRRAVQSGSDDHVATWLRRVTTDVGGLRRAVDRLVIENLASGKLRLDDPLRDMLTKYWADEEYFSWRFNHEADRRTPSANTPR